MFGVLPGTVSYTGATPAGTLSVFNNYVIYQPNVQLSAGTTNIILTNIRNPYAVDANAVVVYSIYARSYESTTTYNDGTAMTPGTITI
jgi:hypothetical protein